MSTAASTVDTRIYEQASGLAGGHLALATSTPERVQELVRAHLAWLRPMPLDDLVDGLVVGLHHPVSELAERTLDLVEARAAELSEMARTRWRLRRRPSTAPSESGSRRCSAPPRPRPRPHRSWSPPTYPRGCRPRWASARSPVS
ncbi:hypothetical protein [Micromonospora sp. CPCC 206061]|uniref:hypothetical protein n=1 Tax=Micromonospora sp. CPCC 206061 TaxID=3122410 RepID=UPI002FF32B98